MSDIESYPEYVDQEAHAFISKYQELIIGKIAENLSTLEERLVVGNVENELPDETRLKLKDLSFSQRYKNIEQRLRGTIDFQNMTLLQAVMELTQHISEVVRFGNHFQEAYSQAEGVDVTQIITDTEIRTKTTGILNQFEKIEDIDHIEYRVKISEHFAIDVIEERYQYILKHIG